VARNRITPEIGEQIKVAHAAGIGLREFARNANIPEGTVLSFAKRHGLTQAIQTAKGDARLSVQSDAITPMQSVAATMQQRAQRHVERIAGVTESVLPRLESMQPSAILDGIHEIEKYDRMARRNFGLGDGTTGNGSISLNILTGQAVVQIAGH
jgi:hypothetical protein